MLIIVFARGIKKWKPPVDGILCECSPIFEIFTQSLTTDLSIYAILKQVLRLLFLVKKSFYILLLS